MFARWLFVKLQAAENALNEGRIDQAYQLAADPSVRKQRRARKLLDGVARPLLARARLHAQAGHYREAVADLDRLAVIDRHDRAASELRERVMNDMKDRGMQRDQHDETYERAAGKLREGRLESGRLAIDQMSADDRKRAKLAQELDIRVKRSEQMLEEAAVALRSGDLLTAVRLWEDARTRHGRTNETERFIVELTRGYRKLMDEHFSKGSLDRFMNTLRAARILHTVDASLDEFNTLGTLLEKAAARLSRGDFPGMRSALMRVTGSARDTRWMKGVLAALDAATAAQDKLLSSPLGVLAPSLQISHEIRTAERDNVRHNEGEAASGDTVRTAPAPERMEAREDAPSGRRPLLLLVDGTGSSILVRRASVKIGRAQANSDVDVPIPADIQSHHADIVRAGEDYFLMALGPAKVNSRPVLRTLLRDGDRIVLGGNAKMVFHRPSDRSETAVLMISDRCRLPQDVDRVVLFKDTCMIGPDPSCHIRTREGDSRLVVFMRDGQLMIRPRPRNGRGRMGEAEPLRLDETRDFGDLRLTLKEYDIKQSPGLA